MSDDFEHTTMEAVMDAREAEIDRQRQAPEFVITEGRAYHRGDVVLLRIKGRVGHESYMGHVRQALAQLTDETGVKFLVLDESVEVVEPVTP